MESKFDLGPSGWRKGIGALKKFSRWWMKEIEENNFSFKEKIWKYNTCCKRARGHMLHLF
jgi:hypothetical protein